MKIFFITVPAAGVEDVVRLIGRPRNRDENETAPFERPDDPELNLRLESLAEATGIASPG